MKDYPHRLVVTTAPAPGPSQGDQDPDEGTWEDNPAEPDGTVVYDGPADVQDRGETLAKDAAGMPTLTSDAVAFLGLPRRIGDIPVGAKAVVTWEDGTTSEAEVLLARRLDETVHLKRLS